MTKTTPSRPIGTRVLTYLAGTVFLVCILIIMADVALILVLRSEKAQNAWYFPYSIFALPFLVVSGPIFLYGVRKLRRGTHGTEDAGLAK